MRKLILGTILAGMLAAPALADVVTLTDGSKREGKVVRENDQEVVLQVTQGRLSAEITFKRDEVKSIERGATAAEQILAEAERRKAALKDKDTAGWLGYAQWLDRQAGFSRDAREAWEKVVKLDPENVLARARLGYQKIGGKWLTEEEAMLAQGLVLVDGRWVKPADKKAAPDAAAKTTEGKVEDIKIALAEEIRKQREEEQGAAEAKRLAEWRTAMLNRAAWAASQQPATTVIQSGGVAMGPYGYGYYGVTTSDGQYIPFVPATGQGVVYYSSGVWLGGGGSPTVIQSSNTTTRSSYGWGVQYRDSHWNVRFGGGGR